MVKDEFLTAQRSFEYFQGILKDAGIDIPQGSSILDFGCGTGCLVSVMRKNGLNAFGVDVEDRFLGQGSSAAERILRRIGIENYMIPFEDETFDFVFSNQVLEHVKDIRLVLSEIRRVLKPGGFCLHVFPTKYRFLESHTYVPFAGIINSYGYLFFWALSGIRNSYQKKYGSSKTASINREYLLNQTNYKSPAQMRENFRHYFTCVRHVESLAIKNGGLRHVYPLVRFLIIGGWLYRYFYNCCLFAEKSRA
jgi:SAM-dependent methyltransferase